MKARINNGRHEVNLTVNNKRKMFILSRLLYWLFIHEFDYENKNLCITYKDNNKLNIDLNNLVLIKRKDLIQGEKHKGICKLTDEIVEHIRSEYKGKSGNNQYRKETISLGDLAKKYGISKTNISMIINNKIWNSENYKLK
jgi:hypothetical protein